MIMLISLKRLLNKNKITFEDFNRYVIELEILTMSLDCSVI